MTILRPALPLGRFYLDRVTRPDTRTLIAERMLDAREDYLRHHLVRGVPTMPGCFAAELAAEAAQELVPDLVVTGLRDLSFESFLKLGGGTGLSPLRLVARLRGRDDEAESAVVDVQVLGDVVSPSGTVLVRDRRHFAATVVLAAEHPRAPRWAPWPAAEAVPVVDPYHVAGGAVRLSGPFVSTTGIRLHPLGVRAWYSKPVAQDTTPGSVFDQFLTPGLLLDGLLRLAAMDLVRDRYIPVAAPTGIRRIDLYAPANDAELSALHVPVELISTPRGPFTGAEPVTRGVAMLPDGRVLLQIKDVTGFPTGYFDTFTGEHVDRSVVEDGRPLTPPARVGAVPI
ncbi:hypothetical protein [Microbispora bryophytorum]|uniref:hypothetical protein n=1 Tax=Microbispora bryophytorum TaxID=1460882 RepID=UPI0033EA48B1